MVFRNFSLGFFLILFISNMYSADFVESKKQQGNVYIFDLHGVVLKTEKKKIAAKIMTTVRNADNRWTLVGYMLNPFFWYKAYKLKNKHDVWDEFFDKLSEQYPSILPHKNAVCRAINTHSVDPKVREIIEKLKKDGAKVLYGSNIGRRSLKIMKQREEGLFNLFYGGYHAHEPDEFTGNIVAKPSLKYYEKMRTYFEKHFGIGLNEPALFIDDSRRNVASAEQSNTHLTAHHYKNPEELREFIDQHGKKVSS